MDKGGRLWLEDASVKWGVWGGIGCWVLAVGLLIFNWRGLPPQMPWFYSLPWGENQLVEKGWLLAIVVAFGGLMVIDVFLARFLGKDELLLKRILVWGGMVTELLMILSLIRVIRVVL